MPGPQQLRHIAPALRPLAVEVARLKPDPLNARVHSEANIAAIMESLRRFGQDQPLVVQKRGLVVRKGNGRLEAAKLLGWKWIAAVVVSEPDREAQVRALIDNRSAELAEWDAVAVAGLQALAAASEEPDCAVVADVLAQVAIEQGFNLPATGADEPAPAAAPDVDAVAASNLSQVILGYPEDEYLEVVGLLGAAMVRAGVATHTEAVFAALEWYEGAHADA